MTKNDAKIRVPDLLQRKINGPKIAMMTAYDFTFARLLDRAGMDVLLVGDSLGMVVQGYETTLPVTMDAMLHHTRAVARGATRALVVADMPFLSHQTGWGDAMRNAGRLLQEGGAAAVKLEGGRAVAETIARLVEAGIPVMGHVGLMPQAVHQTGGFRRAATSETEQQTLLADVKALEQAGAFAVVLECIPAAFAKQVTASLRVPTIGIGAGPECDGQVLVSYDAFGLFGEFVPPFVKQYADLGSAVVKAAGEYVDEVRTGRFPAVSVAKKA